MPISIIINNIPLRDKTKWEFSLQEMYFNYNIKIQVAITIVITLNEIISCLLSQNDCHYNLSQWLNYNSPILNTSSFHGLLLSLNKLKWPPQQQTNLNESIVC